MKQALVLHSAHCVVCCVMRLQPNCFSLEMFDVTPLSCPGNLPSPVNMLFVLDTRSLINNCCVMPLLLIVGLTLVISTVCCCWSANETPMNSHGSSSYVFASLTTLTSQTFFATSSPASQTSNHSPPTNKIGNFFCSFTFPTSTRNSKRTVHFTQLTVEKAGRIVSLRRSNEFIQPMIEGNNTIVRGR